MILHIPHSSSVIPENLRDQIVLSDGDLAAELTLMTDAFTDELFTLPEATILRFPISRLLVDVERFPDDVEEPMSKVGMGMIYTLTAAGKKLKRTLQPRETRDLESLYDTHHQALLREVKMELEKYGKALIVDCHSFPSHPLQCDKAVNSEAGVLHWHRFVSYAQGIDPDNLAEPQEDGLQRANKPTIRRDVGANCILQER